MREGELFEKILEVKVKGLNLPVQDDPSQGGRPWIAQGGGGAQGIAGEISTGSSKGNILL